MTREQLFPVASMIHTDSPAFPSEAKEGGAEDREQSPASPFLGSLEERLEAERFAEACEQGVALFEETGSEMRPIIHPTPGDPYIAATEDALIVIEAKPHVTADEIAYYGKPVLRLRVSWIVAAVFGALFWVALFVFLSPTLREGWLWFERLWKAVMP